MAHRPIKRRHLTAGLTAALLTVPLAVPAAALTEKVDEKLDETEKAVEEAEGADEDSLESVTSQAEGAAEKVVDGVQRTLENASRGDVEGAVDSASEAAGGATDAAGEVLKGATGEELPQTPVGEGGEAAPAPPSESEPAPLGGPGREIAGAPRIQPDGVFGDRSVSHTPTFASGINTSNPAAFSPPATNGAFDEPQTADEDVAAASSPDVAALSEAPGGDGAGGPSPAGVPGVLIGLATGLLVLVGAGHAMHGARRVTVS